MPHTPDHQHQIEHSPHKPKNVFLQRVALSLYTSLLAACGQVSPSNSVLQQEVQQLRQELDKIKDSSSKEAATVKESALPAESPKPVATASPDTQKDQSEIIEKRFLLGKAARSVDISGMPGAVTVEVVAAPEEETLLIRGDKRLVEKLIHISGTTETFRAPQMYSYGLINGSLHVGGSQNIGGITIINGVVQSNAPEFIVPQTALPHIFLKVHEGRTLKIDASLGPVEIMDTKGDIDIKISGVSTLRAGQVRNARLRSSGSAQSVIEAMSGDLDVDISGSGRVVIRGGLIGRADIDVSGSGAVSVNAHVDSLSAEVSGSGRVQVKSAGKVYEDVSGSGSVEVGE